MIISGIPRFALSFVNSFPWFQVATNVMILVLSSEYTNMRPNTFEIACGKTSFHVTLLRTSVVNNGYFPS